MTRVNVAEPLSSPHLLPGWALGWFYATAAICTWDASFIILRPLSLPGGSLHNLWKPYSLYITVDQRYGDVSDPFVYGISLFNYVEVIMNVITIVLHHRNNSHTIPLAFTVTVMTFWKTVFYLYAFTDLGGGASYRVGNSVLAEVLLFLIPNGVWVVLPFFVMAALWPRIIPEKLPPELEVDCSTNENGHATSSGRGVREDVFHAKHA